MHKAALLIGLLLATGACGDKGLAPDANSADKIVLVHYMPWYATPATSGDWGWHWTMNHFDPHAEGAGGHRFIASHYYPLTGPYDSADPHVLEYQTLLMKFAGIDGVIVDWYGTKDYYDYAVLHQNTEHLFAAVKKARLRFAVCYEDQSIKHMIRGGALAAAQAVEHGTEVMRWLQDHWFADDSYVHLDGRPLLLVFGPQYYADTQWQQLFSPLSKRPYFYALNSRRGGADGVFGWPPVHGNQLIAPDTWDQYLHQLYDQSQNKYSTIGAVFPRFHDVYEQAGLHASYGYLDDQNGQTFRQTLELAWQSPSQLIQIVTWNDYGEGTIVEPTVEFAYRDLEVIQSYRSQNPAFPYTRDDLRLPLMLYQLRKQNADARAERVSALLFADGQPDKIGDNLRRATKLLRNP